MDLRGSESLTILSASFSSPLDRSWLPSPSVRGHSTRTKSYLSVSMSSKMSVSILLFVIFVNSLLKTNLSAYRRCLCVPLLGDDCSSSSLRRMLPPLEGLWWCFFLFLMRIFPSISCGEGSACPGISCSHIQDTMENSVKVEEFKKVQNKADLCTDRDIKNVELSHLNGVFLACFKQI